MKKRKTYIPPKCNNCTLEELAILFPRIQSLPNGRTHPQFSDYVEQIHASHITCYHNFYHMEKNQPASGESTIMIMENVNDSKEISVALCSEGNICCSFVFV